MRRVYAFGAFDGLHPGHVSYLRQAKALGTHLTVIIGRDATIEQRKGRPPLLDEATRRELVEGLGIADEVRLGGLGAPLQLLLDEPIDVVCLGYDQRPGPEAIHSFLDKHGKTEVQVVRVRAFLPLILKSSILKQLGLLSENVRSFFTPSVEK